MAKTLLKPPPFIEKIKIDPPVVHRVKLSLFLSFERAWWDRQTDRQSQRPLSIKDAVLENNNNIGQENKLRQQSRNHASNIHAPKKKDGGQSGDDVAMGRILVNNIYI